MCCSLVVLHRKSVTTGWHCNQEEGTVGLGISLRVEDAVTDMCLTFFLQVDAEQYYSELEEKRTDEFNAEKNRISMKRLGIAFVTFRDERMTAVWVNNNVTSRFMSVSSYHYAFQSRGQPYKPQSDKRALITEYWSRFLHLDLFSSIVKDYGCVRCRRSPQQSSITTVVQSHKWGVSYAPAPSDIIWSVRTFPKLT